MSETTEAVSIAKTYKKPIKVKVEPVGAHSIAQVWRLTEKLLREQIYPSHTEDSVETLLAAIFKYIQEPHAICGLAIIGRKPVGIILAHIAVQFGTPSKFLDVKKVWPEEYQDLLLADVFKKAKAMEVFHWEARDLVGFKELYKVVGGRI